MPKRKQGKKTGKDRLDKWYQLAKDQGYRARSAFKLIQLAKKFDFLSKSRTCIDLCAAPGGWSQVAQKNMPAGSKIIAIDLAPIKPLHGVTCVQSDITSDKCRAIVRRELSGDRCDVVLHDGAPNVGTNWASDAYAQNELTLHSLKMACDHLKPGGTFVTKVFRSADYNSLLWVFNQLFQKVDATKPTASRNVSAEIFVMCINFKAGKIDPKFFDPKWVFMEAVGALDGDGVEAGEGEKRKAGVTLKEHLKSGKKRHRSGYNEGDDLRIASAKDFFEAKSPAEILITNHRLNLEAEGCQEILEHPLTTDEIKELCLDLKVLGKRDLSHLLKWRMRILREKEKAERSAKKEEEALAVAAVAKAGRGGVADAMKALEKDTDKAIVEILDKEGRPVSTANDKDSDEEDAEAEEKLDAELADQVEKKRREDKREKKKMMARQKKQEWRRKMSLGGLKSAPTQDQPELFKASKRNVVALEDEDTYVQAIMDAESSEEEQFEEPDEESDDGLDRLARMEVDVAVRCYFDKIQLEDKFKTQMQRIRKKKKETRREQVAKAWAGELTDFNAAIDQQAALQLQDREADNEDDEAESDSDDDLQALRDFQRQQELQDASAEGGIDGSALEALADGPPQPAMPLAKRKQVSGGDSGEDESEEDDEDGEMRDPKAGALVPAENQEALKAKHRASRWFSQDIFQSVAKLSDEDRAIMPLDRDSDASGSDKDEDDLGMRELPDEKLPQMPLTDKEKRRRQRKKEEERKQKQKGKSKEDQEEEDKDKGPMEIAPMEPPKPLVPLKNDKNSLKPSDPRELAETMALGSVLVNSKKSRMELLDAAYNRWTFDRDEALPDWFTEEEDKYNKPELPISKELMDQFRAKLREINARPIRKVAEAKARKRHRLKKRMEKLRSTAMSLADNGEMSSTAKSRQMRKQVSKMARAEGRKVSTVAIKKGGGGKRMEKGKVPKGAKTKVVDRRMKSDKRGEKKAAKRNPQSVKTKVKKKQRQMAKGRRSAGGPKLGGDRARAKSSKGPGVYGQSA